MRSLLRIAVFLQLGFLCLGQAADSPVFFRASFDGEATATLRGAPLAPTHESKMTFEQSEGTGALVLKDGTSVEYDLGPAFPFHAGSLEVRFKPEFPQQPDQAARVIFSLLGPKDGGLNFGFEPQGTRWRFSGQFPDWKRSLDSWYFDKTAERHWNHLLLTWDEKASPAPILRLYRNGKLERGRTESYAHSFEGLRRLIIGGETGLRTSIDEIVIYNQALSEPDVAFLANAFAQPDRFTALLAKREEDARTARAAKETRRAQIAQLKGRIAYISSPRGGKALDMRLPGGIVATGLPVENVGTADLSPFAVIYGPPGGAFQLTKEQDDVIRHYVQEGGGYVGVCAGANYAKKASLLNMSTHSLKNQGLVTVGLQTHPITRGFTGEIVMHHGNGPIMIPGEGCQVIGSFEIGQNFPVTTAAIVAGENGKGRVVAFGPHPTGGGVAFESKGAHFSGSELGTDALLVNALLWAARIE